MKLQCTCQDITKQEWDRLMSSGDYVVMKTKDNDNVSENHT